MTWLGDAVESGFEWLGSSITKGWADLGRVIGKTTKKIRDGLVTGGAVIGAIGLALPFLAPITSLVGIGAEMLGGAAEVLDLSFDSAINKDNENNRNRLESYKKPQGSSASGSAPIGSIIGGTTRPPIIGGRNNPLLRVSSTM